MREGRKYDQGRERGREGGRAGGRAGGREGRREGGTKRVTEDKGRGCMSVMLPGNSSTDVIKLFKCLLSS